jgi:hypothetical protein
MGVPQHWHRRQAIVLAGQLPDNTADALLVLQSLRELIDFMAGAPGETIQRAANVLPFTG